ncbi:MAG: prepilin-type N-terminal cleavage/methylation domain-containing protein [Candidatus Anammoxibacter sp.]
MVNKRQLGFTLMEVAVVLGIIALLGGLMIPMAFNIVSTKKEQAARTELKNIKKAIIGEAKETIYGNEFTFGFVGDIGNVPATLDELNDPGTLSMFSFDTAKNTGAGWNGPYMTDQFDNYKEDPYGNDYVYSDTQYTNDDIGAEVLAKITSMGQDQTLGSIDDLSIEILERDVRSDIVGIVKDSLNLGITNIDVNIYYPINGILTMVATQTSSSGVYRFLDVPMGDRVIIPKPKVLFNPDSAFASGSKMQNVEFVITNYSEETISISSFEASYSSDPVAYCSTVLVNGLTVLNITGSQERPGSGDLIFFSGGTQSMAASTLINESNIRRIQTAKVVVPDLMLGSLGAGGSLKIEMQDFVDTLSGGGNMVNMSGASFEITFSNGSVITFVPKRKK